MHVCDHSGNRNRLCVCSERHRRKFGDWRRKCKNFAFADAGVDPVSAQITKIEFDYEQGQFVYEIEFVAEGTEYEYWIKASDGSVVKKEIEIVTLDGSNATVTAKITLDDAKQTALEDAGVAISDATFTKEKLDLDDGDICL